MGQSLINRGWFRFRLLITAAAVLFIAVGCRDAASAADQTPSIQGVWDGRYVCAQGPTGATLAIRTVPHWPGIQVYLHRLLMGWLRNPETKVQEVQPKRRQIEAQFRFYALPENPRVPTGAFELTGTYDPTLGILDLYPSKWIELPECYNLLGLKGVLTEDGQSLKGALDGAGCGAIILRRAEAPAQPSAEGTAPSAQVEFNEELLKLNREVFELYKAGEYDKALATANEALGTPSADTAIIAYRNLLRVQGWIGSLCLTVERELFGQATLDQLKGPPLDPG